MRKFSAVIFPSPPSSTPCTLIVSPYVASSTSFGSRFVTRLMGPVCSLIWSIGRTPSQTKSAFVVANWGNTRPGQSQSIMFNDRWMVWKCLVFPGVEDTLTFFSPSNELMVLDFPTFGYPTRPTTSFVGWFPDESVNAKTRPKLVMFA